MNHPAALQVHSELPTLLQRAASVGTLLKTIAGVVAGIVAGGLAVYGHFAKTTEVRHVQCLLADQIRLTNDVITTSREVRSALVVLKQNLNSPGSDPASTKDLVEELSKAIGRIEKSLDKIDDARATIQVESSKGVRTC